MRLNAVSLPIRPIPQLRKRQYNEESALQSAIKFNLMLLEFRFLTSKTAPHQRTNVLEHSLFNWNLITLFICFTLCHTRAKVLSSIQLCVASMQWRRSHHPKRNTHFQHFTALCVSALEIANKNECYILFTGVELNRTTIIIQQMLK